MTKLGPLTPVDALDPRVRRWHDCPGAWLELAQGVQRRHLQLGGRSLRFGNLLLFRARHHCLRDMRAALMGAQTITRWVPSALRATALMLGVAILGSACGAPAQGEQTGAAFADLHRLADQVTAEALECAHDSGAKDAYISDRGGIVSDPNTPGNIVPDCFAQVLEAPEYAVFADDSIEALRISYDGFVAIHECLVREGFTSANEDEIPTFEEWMDAGRSWSPYGELVRAGEVARMEAASSACEPS